MRRAGVNVNLRVNFNDLRHDLVEHGRLVFVEGGFDGLELGVGVGRHFRDGFVGGAEVLKPSGGESKRV